MLTAADTPFTIRPAITGDAALSSRLDIETWGNAYAGQLPDALLDVLPTGRWHDTAFWQARLADTGFGLPKRRSPSAASPSAATPNPTGRITPARSNVSTSCNPRADAVLANICGQRPWTGLVEEELVPIIVTVFDFNHEAQRFHERLGGRCLGRQVSLEWRGMTFYECVYGYEGHEQRH